MRKICFVFNSLSIGGSQKIEAFVANACHKNHYDISIICMTKSDIGVELNPDINITYIPYFRNKNPIDKVLFLIKLRNVIKKINPDLLCVFLADITRVVVLATQFLKIPILASERGAPGRHGKKLQKYTRAFSQCHTVVFQTEQAKNYYKLSNTNTIVIPNPCFLRWTHNEEPKHIDKIILSAGRICKQKRFDILIDAFNIVQAYHNEYKLLIYGDGPLLKELETKIEDYRLKDKVLFCGYSKDVFFDAGIPEIFVLSSDYEGIPNVLMEAMALGTMCISTDCEPGGARLLIEDGINGLIVPTGDAKKLAERILYAIDNPDRREEMAQIAKKIVKQFAPSIIEKMWLKIISDILSSIT